MVTPIVNSWLNSILVGVFNSLGRATDIKGGFKYCTRNSLRALINASGNFHLVPMSAYVWNSVSLTTLPFGLDPAMRTLLSVDTVNKEYSGHKYTYPEGVRLATEW